MGIPHRQFALVRRAAEAVWRDLRLAARILARNPGLTAAAVVTLSLGIGATTAIYAGSVAGPALLVGTATVASYMAARRASRVDPTVALRSE